MTTVPWMSEKKEKRKNQFGIIREKFNLQMCSISVISKTSIMKCLQVIVVENSTDEEEEEGKSLNPQAMVC